MELTSTNPALQQLALYAPSSVWDMTITIQWYVRQEIATMDRDVVHDITRTVQVKVAHRPRGFNKTFLRIVIQNAARDYLRSMYSDRKASGLIEIDQCSTTGNTTDSPESTVIDRELIAQVKSHISPWLFTSFQQMADGVSQRNVYETYAQEYCKSYGDFRQIIYRTRKKLQSEWN